MSDTQLETPAKKWWEDVAFKDAVFFCPDDEVRFDPPTTPAVCPLCGEDLVLAQDPGDAPTPITHKVYTVVIPPHISSQFSQMTDGNGNLVLSFLADQVNLQTMPGNAEEQGYADERYATRKANWDAAQAITEVKDGSSYTIEREPTIADAVVQEPVTLEQAGLTVVTELPEVVSSFKSEDI